MAGSAEGKLQDEAGTPPAVDASVFPPATAVEEPAEARGPESDGALDTLRELGQMHAALLTLTADGRLAGESVLRGAQHLTGAARGMLFLLEEGELEAAHAVGFAENADPDADTLARVTDSWTGKRPLWRAAAGIDQGWSLCLPVSFPGRATAPYIPDRRRLSIARIPFGEPMGLLFLDRIPAREEEHPALLARLSQYAALASTVLLNARWLHLATTDRLTGLLTRDRFTSAVADLFEQAEGDRLPVTVLLIDITGLREINAAFGRARGDELIHRVARALRRLSRRSDVLARYGGDEFAIALPNTDTAEALQVADRIRRTAPSIPTSGEDSEVRSADHKGRCVLTRLAVGIATYPTHGRSAWEVLLHADQALHTAARQGHSRVEIWTPEEDGASPRADRLAGVMTGHFADDSTNVRSLLELMHALLTEATSRDLWRRFTDGVTEAADAHLGVLFRADPSGKVIEESWAGAEGGGAGAPPLLDEKGLERARALASAALRTGRPARDEAVSGPRLPSCRAAFPVPLRGALRTVLYLESPAALRFATDAGMEQIAAFITWLRPALERVVGDA